MKDLSFLLSLTTADNDYQAEQALAAERAARRLGVSIEIVYADNDAVSQSQQILKRLQASERRPDAIILEPVSVTAMPQVARAALAERGARLARPAAAREIARALLARLER